MARVTQTLVDTVTLALRKIIQYKIKIIKEKIINI